MPSMSEIVSEHTELSEAEHAWLKMLVADWQLLADLSFSDLVLWVPNLDENVYWAAAQIRPTTGPTCLVDDVIGNLIAYAPEHLVSEAFLSGQITQTSQGKLQAGIPVAVHAIPVPFRGRVIGVLEQHTSQLGVRMPSTLEKAYLETAALLAGMVTAGQFPVPGDASNQMLSPRVGDGFIRLDGDGNVVYASPNALSAYRRIGLIGDLVDEHLASLSAGLLPVSAAPVDDSVKSALSGRDIRRAELVSGEAHMLCGPFRCASTTAGRRDRVVSRRERSPDPGAGAGHEGRDDSRDPPPGQEQPADRRRAAADAGPPDRLGRGQDRLDGCDVAGGLDRDRARDAVPGVRRGGRVRQGGRRPAADGGRRGDDLSARRHRADRVIRRGVGRRGDRAVDGA